jgi:hypothetical protein
VLEYIDTEPTATLEYQEVVAASALDQSQILLFPVKALPIT